MALVNRFICTGLKSTSVPPFNPELKILNLVPNSLLNSKGCHPKYSWNISVRWKLFKLDNKWKWPHITKPKHLGVRRKRVKGCFREDGEWVSAGTILVRQIGLIYFPGLNVGVGRNLNLFAMEHGRVMITTEKVNPNWDHSFMQLCYGQYQNTAVPLYKTYFHIIATPMPQTFKLVNQI